MAQAFAAKYGLNSSSAGTMPSEKVNETVVAAMKEKGINVSSNKPKLLTTEMINQGYPRDHDGLFSR